MAYPDLLHREPLPSAPKRALSEALTFGFARGVDPQRLLSLACPTLRDSSFEQGAFADDLFIAELISGCFPLRAGARTLDGANEFFRCVLLSPPTKLEDVRFRQEIFSELAQDEERLKGLGKAYLALRAFREALCGSEHFSGRTMGIRRRLDVLIAFRSACDELLRVFGTSRSGLSRLADWVEAIRAAQNYERLLQLLAFEDSRAVLETRLQTGYDGTLRRFEIVNVAVAEHEAFPRGPLSRFVRRVISFVKGYRFSEEDVMANLLDRVFSDLENEVVCLLSVSLQLEFYLRGMAFRSLCQERNLEVCVPQLVPVGQNEEECRLEQLFNPWLMTEKDTIVVPCDVSLDRDRSINIVTGPNSGGKTRLLQSLAITQLLAQTGLFVPAKRACVPCVEQLFLSLIEHAQPHQSEGRLGSELIRIRQVFETTGPRALVLMDELCSGTNPSEGERIFDMVIDLLEELGPKVWITTHFLDFAGRLEQRRGDTLRFLQVELDESHLPTYQFAPGVAQTSLARNTAARLGVTREELIELMHRHRLKADRP